MITATGRDLDIRIARALGCAERHWSASLDEIHHLEKELESRGLWCPYLDTLFRQISKPAMLVGSHGQPWNLRHATAEQCAQAACGALEEEQELAKRKQRKKD